MKKANPPRHQLLATRHRAAGAFLLLTSYFLLLLPLPLSAQSTKEALQLSKQGNALYKQGKYREALPLYERSLAIREKALAPQHPDTALSLNNLASVYQSMGDYAKALPLHERALAFNEKALGSQHPHTASSLSHLASVYHSMGDFAKALPLHERALAINEKALGSQHPDTATSFNELASVFRSMGNYPKALPLYERALGIREKALGPEHPNTAKSLSNLARVYRDLGDDAKALPLYRRALAIQEKALGSEHPDTALSLFNLANIYTSMGDFAKALSFQERSLAIWEKTLGPQHPYTAKAYISLASVNMAIGNKSKALQSLEKALTIQEKALGPEHPDTAISLIWLGDIHRAMGDYAKAHSFHERTLTIWEKTLGPQHPKTAHSLDLLATLSYHMGDLLSARNYATRQIAAKQRELQSILTLDERSRLVWQRENLSYWAACVLRPEPLAQLVLRRKGVVLDSLLEDRALAISAQHDPEGRAKLDQIAALRSQLAKFAFEENRSQEASRLQEQIGLLQRSLSSRASLGGRVRQSAEITLDAILPALSNGAVLVDFIRFRDPKLKGHAAVCYGAVVTGADGSPAFVRIDGAVEIDRAIVALRAALAQGQEADVETHTRFLSEKLWQPVAQQIPEGTGQIFLCPEANLNFLSFAALLEGDGRFAAEKYSIAYLGSGRDLARPSSGQPSKTLALLANPAFDLTGSAAPAKDMLAMRSAEADVFGSISLPPLPGTEAEAKALQSLAKTFGWETQAALGREATESKVRNAPKPGILHLATHGFYLNSTTAAAPASDQRGMSVVEATEEKPAAPRRSGVDPMRASGVALAGAQSTLKSWSQRKAPDPQNDGILTAEEVAVLDLEGTWLVTLSACETGVGEARSGEGVFGLRRAFMIAGAENLLMTLWPVADDTTAKIMADFYQESFATGDAPGSLAKVQRDWLVKLRQDRGLLAAVREAGPFAMVTMTTPSVKTFETSAEN